MKCLCLTEAEFFTFETADVGRLNLLSFIWE